MKALNFTIELTSDAEIGSGRGGEVVNSTVTRDHKGQPVIRATHLKGLMRDQLQSMGAARGWGNDLADLVFGREGREGDSGCPGQLRMSDSTSEAGAEVRTIIRTSLTELGVAKANSLRTVEAVAAGSRFHGSLQVPADVPAVVDLASRLALLSVVSIGGGRTRGGGCCHVSIEGEGRTPGALLKELDRAVGEGVPQPPPLSIPKGGGLSPGSPTALLRLVFRADSPVCCPETPVVGNVIRSGLGIPPSAVQGAILGLLSAADPSLSQAVFEDRRTRFWPLLPCAEEGAAGEIPVPVRVDLTHRMSKLADEKGQHTFRDPAIETYKWQEAANGSPLKGADGVLLRSEDGQVELWRSRDMPWLLTSHSVHHGGRNLFTVESQSPMVFSGLMAVPEEAAEVICRRLEEDPAVAFGKARTVRGGGRLSAERCDMGALLSGWKERVFVLQSPAAIPDGWDMSDGPAETRLAELVEQSWKVKVAANPRQAGEISVTALAQCGVRFGWNRHGAGGSHVGETRRLQARRVFLPGSVFVLEETPPNLEELLCRGLGVEVDGDVDGRCQGYGAVLPHPGLAQRRRVLEPDCAEIKSQDDAAELALDWFNKTSGAGGPSPSQIAAVAGRIRDKDGSEAVAFLGRQKDDRPSRVWERWKPVWAEVGKSIDTNARVAARALRIWQDLSVANGKSAADKEGR